MQIMQELQQTSPIFKYTEDFNQTTHVAAHKPIVFIDNISYDLNSHCSVWDVFKESQQGNIMVILTWSEFFSIFVIINAVQYSWKCIGTTF